MQQRRISTVVALTLSAMFLPHRSSPAALLGQVPSNVQATETSCRDLLTHVTALGRKVTVRGSLHSLQFREGKTVATYVCKTADGELEMDSGRVLLFGAELVAGSNIPAARDLGDGAARLVLVRGEIRGTIKLGLSPASQWTSPLIRNAMILADGR